MSSVGILHQILQGILVCKQVSLLRFFQVPLFHKISQRIHEVSVCCPQELGCLGVFFPIIPSGSGNQNELCQADIQGIGLILNKMIDVLMCFFSQIHTEIPQKVIISQNLLQALPAPDAVTDTLSHRLYTSGCFL